MSSERANGRSGRLVSDVGRSWAAFCAAMVIIAAAAAGGCGKNAARPSAEAAREPLPRISGTIPAAGEPFRERVTVVFDRAIRTVGARDMATSPPLQFVPPMEGTFESGPNFISFVPRGDAPKAVIEARLTSAVVALDGRALTQPERPVVFTPFRFEPARLWRIDRGTTSTVFGLAFPCEVEPAAVDEHVTLLDEKEQPVAFTAAAGTNPLSVRLIVPEGGRTPVVARVAAGLPEAGGRFKLAADRVLPMPDESALEIYGGEELEVGANGQRVQIVVNQPVLPEALRRHLSVVDRSTTAAQPLLFSFEDETSTAPRTRYRVLFSAPDPRIVQVRLRVEPGLRGTRGLPLMQPFVRELAALTRLRIEDSDWSTGGRDGLTLRISLSHPADLEALRARLAIEPAVEGLEIDFQDARTIRLRGRFLLDRSYTVTLAPGVPFAGWAVSTESVSGSTVSPERVESYLAFPVRERYYIPRRIAATLPLETRGIEKVDLTLYRLFPSNIAVALDDIEAEGRRYYYSQFASRRSEEVGKGTLLPAARTSGLIRSTVALQEMTTAPLRGVYLVQARTENRSDQRICLLTDIGLVAHWQSRQLLLYAHDLYSLAPIADARVTLYSRKNQILGEGRTDANGLVLLEGFEPALGEPGVAVAEKGNDYTYLRLEPIEIADRTQRAWSAADAFNPEANDGYIYADRELYRPGDTVHLAWTVRRRFGDAVGGAPFVLRVRKPNDQLLLERTIALDDLGVASLDLATQRSDATGRYKAELLVPGGENIIATYEFQLEEFVPNRMKATLAVPDAFWVAGTPRVVTLEGQHLFGAPAAGRAADLRVSFSRGVTFPSLPGFRFDNDSELEPQSLDLGRQATGQDGRARFEVNWIPPAGVTFPMRAELRGRLFDLGGRSVPARAQVVAFPTTVSLGVALRAESGRVLAQAAAIMPDGSPAAIDAVTLTLERRKWAYNVRSFYSHREPDWSTTWEKIDARTLPLSDGHTSATFALIDDGSYRVRVDSPQTRQYSTAGFHAWSGRAYVGEAAEPSFLQLSLDRPSYMVGERARLRIASAFDGAALVVIQGNQIRQARTVAITSGTAEVEIPVDAAMHPNAWIEVTALRGVEPGRPQVYPFASFEAIALVARDPARGLVVSFPGLKTGLRPAEAITVPVAVRDVQGRPVAAAVTIAAVDEGIHQITGYTNPDPAGHYARRRRPDLRIAHYYEKLVQSFEEPAPGGDAGGIGSRISHAPPNWIRTVALWSGVVRTGPDGMTSVTLPAAALNGRLRLVAVALSPTASGTGAAELTLRDPVMLETGLPRVLRPGDRAQVVATLYNTTAATRTATLAWTTSGSLTAETAGPARLTLAPGGEATTEVAIRAGGTGAAAIDWRAEIDAAGSEPSLTVAQSDAVPVAEPAAWTSQWRLNSLAPGTSVTLDLSGFLPDAQAELDVVVGANPLLRLRKALDGLAGYPYGCVEQTTSRLMGLYLLRRQSALLEGAVEDPDRIGSWIAGGIRRLWAMQTSSGGLSFWPGGWTPNAYGSVYAFHFLTLVRNDREFAPDERLYGFLHDYVRRVARADDGRGQASLYLRAYAIFTLSLAGDPAGAELIERFDHLSMPRSGRYLLAAALAVATKDYDRVQLYLARTPSEAWSPLNAEDPFHSPVRASAVELLALMHMQGDPGTMATLADGLVRALESGRRATTQEQAFTIAALARYLDEVTSASGGAAARVAWPGGESTIEGMETLRRVQRGPGALAGIANTGSVPIYLAAVSRGVPAQRPAGPVAEGISISRRFVDAAGKAVPPGPLRQGQAMIVELEIGNARPLRHVVVADLLPAGVEVVNPRLEPGGGAVGTLPHAPIEPTHLELRDDRLLLFFDALPAGEGRSGGGRHHFYYVVEPVTPGNFQHPAATVEAMYDPAVNGATAEGRVVVER